MSNLRNAVPAFLAFALSLPSSLVIGLQPALAEQLFDPKNPSSLISDRRAGQPGDVVTVLITENSSAANTSSTSTNKGFGLGGTLVNTRGRQSGGQASVSNNFDGQGTIERTGKVLAQISVKVDSVMANGDLLVSGAQAIDINGEKTNIQLKGRIRPIDIAADNTVPSNRLADAMISYDGQGYITDNTQPGWIPRFWNWVKPW